MDLKEEGKENIEDEETIGLAKEGEEYFTSKEMSSMLSNEEFYIKGKLFRRERNSKVEEGVI